MPKRSESDYDFGELQHYHSIITDQQFLSNLVKTFDTDYNYRCQCRCGGDNHSKWQNEDETMKMKDGEAVILRAISTPQGIKLASIIIL